MTPRCRPRGRPKGSTVPLSRSKVRFEIATWFALHHGLGFSPYAAGKAVTFLVSSSGPITAESVEGHLLKLSTSHRSSVKSRADHIRRTAGPTARAASEPDYLWLMESTSLIAALVFHFDRREWAAVHLTLRQLHMLGWGEVLNRVWLRLAPALRSNAPPQGEPLSRAVRALLAQVRADEGTTK